MYLFKNKNGELEEIKQVKFNLEKEMQILTEKNLEKVFGLEFIKTEFQLNNLRVDTLAFDNETNSFVIIEYKRGSSYSVIDQGMTYLALLLNNKADFIQELARKRNKFIDKSDIDWSQSRVIIIADGFNRYQKESINFKDLPIELYELKQFENGIIVYNPIIAEKNTQSIKTITKFQTNEFKEVKNEIKTYSIDDLIKPHWNKTREFYEELREFILELDDEIVEDIKKMYITYKKGSKGNFILLWPGKDLLWIEFRGLLKNDFKYDIYDKVKNIPESYGWGKCSKFIIKNKNDLDYAKNLIKEAYLKYDS